MSRTVGRSKRIDVLENLPELVQRFRATTSGGN